MEQRILVDMARFKRFPLWALLTLYERGHARDLYIDDFEGFKELVAWLSPIEIPAYSIERIPKLHTNYELNKIAEILNVHPSIVYKEYKRVIWMSV